MPKRYIIKTIRTNKPRYICKNAWGMLMEAEEKYKDQAYEFTLQEARSYVLHNIPMDIEAEILEVK